MNIIKRHIPKGANNPGKKITVDKIVIHYSGVAGCPADRLATCLINNNADILICIMFSYFSLHIFTFKCFYFINH